MPAKRLVSDAASPRAAELAERFVTANDAFIAYIETLTPAQWQTLIVDEQRTVAALARHVAWAYTFEVSAFELIANGREPTPVTIDQLAEANAIHGAEYAELPLNEAVALLRQNAGPTATFVRNLTDKQLARSGRYLDQAPAITIDNWIRRVLINHIEMHTRSIKAALA